VLWVLLGAAYRNVVIESRPHRQLPLIPQFRRPAWRPSSDALGLAAA
jgi:hypothetical protein